MADLVDQLVTEGLAERVTPDPATAALWLADADRHVAAARLIVTMDHNGAYALAYDAARKAVSAHMLANGVRTRAVAGAHWAVARYAQMIGGPAQHLDNLRRNRNRAEYAVRVFGEAEVRRGIQRAGSIVDLVRSDLE